MITRCPACSTSFHVSTAQLDAASGSVRCGSCLHIFNAPEHETEDTFSSPTVAEQLHVDHAAETGIDAAGSLSGAADIPGAEVLEAEEDVVSLIQPEPILLTPLDEGAGSSGQLLWWVASFACLLLLSAQYIFWNMENLRTRPAFGPALTILCGQFRCAPPEQIALDQLSARNLIIRSHTELDQSLAVDFLLVNKAPFRQRLPMVEIEFSRLNGTRSAIGRFLPVEYAGKSADTLLQPGEQRRIQLSINDPGEDSVNYMVNLADSPDG